jgi:hypothetical protein
MAAVVTVNTADVEPALTVTEVGTWSAEFVFDRVTTEPPA